jgi:hypothetical protein
VCGIVIVRPYKGVKSEAESLCQQCYSEESQSMQYSDDVQHESEDQP